MSLVLSSRRKDEGDSELRSMRIRRKKNQLEVEFAKLLTQVRVNLTHLDIVAIALAAQRIGYDICLPRRVLNINRVLSNGLKPSSLPQVQVGMSEQVLQAFVVDEHIHLPP